VNLYRGHDGIRTFFRAWLGAWDEWDLEVEEITAIDRDRVLVVFRQHGRMRGTRVPLDNRTAQLWTLRDELVVRVQDLPSREEALEAAGVAPDRLPAPDRSGRPAIGDRTLGS
jgi:ketosteroid isomerase-like protein